MLQHLKTLTLILIVLLAFSACNNDEPTVIAVGPNWKAVHELKSSDKSFTVNVNGKKQIRIDDALELTINSAKKGRLWVVRVDPNDQVDVLFPNEYSRDNTIKAYQPISVPPKGANYSIAATDPVGHSTLACIVTTGDTDLGDVFSSQGFSSKALTIIKNSPEWGIGKLIVEVTAK